MATDTRDPAVGSSLSTPVAPDRPRAAPAKADSGIAWTVPGRAPLPDELQGPRLRKRLLLGAAIVVVIVGAVVLVPGLASLRHRFDHAKPSWLVLAGILKVLSGVSYVLIFRAVFCRRMPWRLGGEIGIAELGANALLPTGGAGGLALGAWALSRGGMAAPRIARRTVAFFLLTSCANVGALVIVGVGLAIGIFPGHTSMLGAILPAAIAVLAVVATLCSPLAARALKTRLVRRGHGEGKRARLLEVLAGGVEESVALLREHDPWLVLGAIGYLSFDVMMVWACFHAFGSAPDLSIVWIAYLIGELGGLLPIPGGLGGVDLGLVGAYVAYGVPIAAATAAVLAYRALALWIPAMLGSAAFIALRREPEYELQC
jgi:uncharacterized membrane protein YbhN (UPF0104 family)